MSRARLGCLLTFSWLALALPALAQDVDGDGLSNAVDNCIQVANATQCDTDFDGFGNACDGDYDQNGSVNANDFGTYFVEDFSYQGLDTGRGTDHDCDGLVLPGDFSGYFIPQFTTTGVPGPSALSCAGSVPCGDGDLDGVNATVDNCYFVANPTQSDSDGDGIGNACDPAVSRGVEFDELLAADAITTVTDSQETLHGFYLARTATSGTSNAHIKYFTQPVGGALTAEVIATTASGESFTSFALDAALDSQDRPCLVWSKVLNGVYRFFYGCRGTSGFSFEEISDDLPLATTVDYDLALDAADQPHLAFYQHLPLDLPSNHRVRHAWKSGGTWHKENIPLPPAYQPPTYGDARSGAACLDVDENNVLHFAFNVAEDFFDAPPGTTDYENAVAYASKHPSNGWSTSTVIRAPGAGETGEVGRSWSCQLVAAGGGRLHLAYDRSTSASTNGVFYVRRGLASTPWRESSLGAGGTPSALQLDAGGNVYFTYGTTNGAPPLLGTQVRFVRVDADRRISSRTLDANQSSGSAVWVQSSTGIGDTTCDVFHTSKHDGSAVHVIRTAIEGCDYPFQAPALDHIAISGERAPTFSQEALNLGAAAGVSFSVDTTGSYQLGFHSVDPALMNRNPRLVNFPQGGNGWFFFWTPQPGDEGVRTFIVTATAPSGNQARHLIAFHIVVPTADADGDLVKDGADNCTSADNGPLEQAYGPDLLCPSASCVGNQLDADRDGFGDVCEPNGPSGLECQGQAEACP